MSKPKRGWWRRKPDLWGDEALLFRAINADDLSPVASLGPERILDALTALHDKGYVSDPQFTEILTQLWEKGYVKFHFIDFSPEGHLEFHLSDPSPPNWCKVFVDADVEPDAVAEIAAASLPDPSVAKLDQDRFSPTVTYGAIEIHVNRNLDAGPDDQAPDAPFLTWPMIISVEPAEHVTEDELVEVVGSLLTSLWDKNFGAVAAADFEARLPRLGGWHSGRFIEE